MAEDTKLRFLKPGDVIRLTAKRRLLERQFDALCFDTVEGFSKELSQQMWEARNEGEAQARRDVNAWKRASDGQTFASLDENDRLIIPDPAQSK